MRRVLVFCTASLVVFAGAEAGLAWALSPSPEAWGTASTTFTERAGDLTLTVPAGFRTRTFHDCVCWGGTQPPRSGAVIADVAASDPTLFDWTWPEPPPDNRVGLSIDARAGMGPPVIDNLHLPLTLKQPWKTYHLASGGVGARWGFFKYRGEEYGVTYWSGPKAPAKDRAAVLRALRSIRAPS